LLAKFFLPAILIYILIGVCIAIAGIYIVINIIDREEASILGIIGAIISIAILIQFWKWA